MILPLLSALVLVHTAEWIEKKRTFTSGPWIENKDIIIRNALHMLGSFQDFVWDGGKSKILYGMEANQGV